MTHPKVNFQIAAAAKFPVADLEGNCHLVVLMQRLVEAFALVGLHLDVVGGGQREEAARRGENSKGRKQHRDGSTVCLGVLACFWVEV